MHPMDSATTEIAQAAARLVVEEGLEYGPAKRWPTRHFATPICFTVAIITAMIYDRKCG